MQEILQKDFGFQQIMWVFSGRRGLHCWIFDDRARFLDRRCRDAILGYCRVIKGENPMNVPSSLPHVLQRSLKIIDKYWDKHILNDLDVFASPEAEQVFLRMFKAEGFSFSFVSSAHFPFYPTTILFFFHRSKVHF